MSKDLDKKLHEVLSSVGELYYPEHEYNKSDSYDKSNKATRDDAIQQIKDCFIADGWVDTNKPIDSNIHGVSIVEVNDLMTGESWYKKFKQELGNPSYMQINDIHGGPPESIEVYKPGKVLEAAKRASGVKR